jgi:hypothetical protein
MAVPLPGGTSAWRFRIDALPLRPGAYQLDLWVSDAVGIHDHLQPALQLEVFDRQQQGWGPRYDARYDGPVFCEYDVVRDDQAVAAPAGAMLVATADASGAPR